MARFFDSLESNLTEINGKLNAQQQQMAQLHEQTLATTFRRELATFQNTVLAQLTALEQRVAANEARTQDQGTLLTSCADGLSAAQLHINRKVEASHLMKLKGSFESALQQTFQRLDENKAPRTCLTQLDLAQRTVRQEVVALQQMVACKVDRSTLPELQGLSARWHEVEATETRHGARLDELDGALAAVGALQRDDAKAIATLRELEPVVASLASSDSIAALTTQTEALRVEVDAARAAAAAAREQQRAAAASQMATLRSRIEELNGTIGTHAQTLRDELDGCVKLAHVGEEARMISDDGSVDAASVEAATEGGEPIAWLRALLAQRGAKLVKTTTQLAAMEAKCAALAEQNEALERGQSKLAKQVDVTINFVEWFAERGEAYDHNAGLLERHMQSLATMTLQQQPGTGGGGGGSSSGGSARGASVQMGFGGDGAAVRLVH